jgi:hypothetical protein
VPASPRRPAERGRSVRRPVGAEQRAGASGGELDAVARVEDDELAGSVGARAEGGGEPAGDRVPVEVDEVRPQELAQRPLPLGEVPGVRVEEDDLRVPGGRRQPDREPVLDPGGAKEPA